MKENKIFYKQCKNGWSITERKEKETPWIPLHHLNQSQPFTFFWLVPDVDRDHTRLNVFGASSKNRNRILILFLALLFFLISFHCKSLFSLIRYSCEVKPAMATPGRSVSMYSELQNSRIKVSLPLPSVLKKSFRVVEGPRSSAVANPGRFRKCFNIFFFLNVTFLVDGNLYRSSCIVWLISFAFMHRKSTWNLLE